MYKRESEGLLKHFDFMLLDILCLQIAFVLAYYISGHGNTPYSSMLYRSMAILIEVINFMALIMCNTLKGVLKRDNYREFSVTVQHTIIVGGLWIFYLFLIKESQEYSRLALVFTFTIYTVITYIARVVWKGMLEKKLVNVRERTLLIVTNSSMASSVIHSIKEDSCVQFKIVGLVLEDKDAVGEKIEDIEVVANIKTAASYVCQEWVDEVLIVLEGTIPYPSELVHQLTETGVVVHMNLAELSDVPGKKQFVEKIANYTVMTTSINYVSANKLFIKRLIDIVGGIVGCLLTFIIFIFVAPAIYISSPGPIFFSQERVGKNGKKFKMYKFRSMYMDAEERKAELMKDNRISDGKMFKLDFDPRVIGNKILPNGTKRTGLGNFLRVTSLDEFPQFFNVLKGDMSIVGTRPPLPGEVSLYELHHRSRLAIKPGITGMWQISGRSDITDFEKVVELDKQYISEWSIGLDVKILLRTIPVVFRKCGSM